MANPVVIQIVGFKNSGKTTLIEAWVKLLDQYQLSAAVIKHHGHGGPLALPPEETDSMRALRAGAVSAIASTEGMIQLHMQGMEVHLSELIAMTQLTRPDVILIEGYKDADYPKVVLVREAADWRELSKLKRIIGVIAHEGVELPGEDVVYRDDTAAVQQRLYTWINRR